MKDLVLYCKSYRRDFLRLKRLLHSIERHNVDQIPFYISTPQSDRALMIQVVGDSGYEWVSDEEIVLANPKSVIEKYQTMPGALSQQIIKSEFWRLKISKNYLSLDSDSQFIKNFFKSDLVMPNGDAYTVLHQNKEFFQLAVDRDHERVEEDLKLEAQRVQNSFGRQGPTFYCAPSPFIWSASVWESLDREYLDPRKISIWDLITPQHPESLIYGEALLKFKAIPLIPIEPLFKVYHYDWQYYLMRRLGESKAKLTKNYLGVIYQSAWEAELNLEPSKKSPLSRLLKKIKRFLRFLQSFL